MKTIRNALEMHRHRLGTPAEVQAALDGPGELRSLLTHAPHHVGVLGALLASGAARDDEEEGDWATRLADAIGDRPEWPTHTCARLGDGEDWAHRRFRAVAARKGDCASDAELRIDGVGRGATLSWREADDAAVKSAYAAFLSRCPAGGVDAGGLVSPWDLGAELPWGYFRRSALLDLFAALECYGALHLELEAIENRRTEADVPRARELVDRCVALGGDAEPVLTRFASARAQVLGS